VESTPNLAGDDVEQVARPARYGELVAAGAAVAVWLVLLVQNGPRFGFQTIWLLLIGASLGTWTVTIRLRFSRSRLRLTLGPWSRAVDLNQLESIRWKDTGFADMINGTIYVRDRSRHMVPVYLCRFQRGNEWGPLLLQAAAASGATVDARSRQILEHGGDPDA
jgi:hypothetical protein